MARSFVPKRFWIWCLSLTCFALKYALQSSMSMAILAMSQSENETLPDFGPRYPYTPYEQSSILGTYYIGMTVAGLPVGLMLDRIDCVRWYIFGGMLIAGLLTLLTPAIGWSVMTLIAFRTVMGAVQGSTVAAMHKMFSHWVPADEMGRFMGSMSGSNVGTIFTLAISGVVIETLGWQYTFYLSGVAAMVYCAAWWYTGYPTPERHPRITAAERQHIEDSRKSVTAKPTRVPMMEILTSVPVWALLWLNYSNMWGFTFLVSSAPKYMHERLGFSISSTGFLSTMPYVSRVLGALVFAMLNDYIHRKRWMSTMNMRRVFSVFSHIMPGVLLAALPFCGTDPYVCVAVISLAYAFNGAVTQTAVTNSYDLSPNFSATVIAITVAIGSTSGFLTPTVVTYFTNGVDKFEGWRNVFLLGAVIYIVPALIFMCFGSASIQPWNFQTERSEDDEKRTVSPALLKDNEGPHTLMLPK